jgi:PTS system N-acetylgalactosamine-specific IIA component
MTSSGVAAIIVGHGDFAAGIVSAIAQITGHGDRLLPLSNRDLSAEDLEQRIREMLAATGARVVFTDLPAGSMMIAARKVVRSDPDLVVVSSANLVVVLDFLMHLELGPREAAAHAVDRGRAALGVHGAPRAG